LRGITALLTNGLTIAQRSPVAGAAAIGNLRIENSGKYQ